MKNLTPVLLAALTAGWVSTAAFAAPQATEAAPPAAQQPVQQETPLTGQDFQAVTNTAAQPAAQDAATPATQTNAVTPLAAVPPSSGPPITGTADDGFRFNFRGVPVDKVLGELSEAAGFTIIRQADTRGAGTVDMVSDTPVPKDQIAGLLSKVLASSGLAASQDGRTLTIMTTANATLNSGTPVIPEGNPANIPQDSEVATYIIPVHSLNPTQLTRDLAILKPSDLVMTPNEGGNAVIMTGHRADIHRFAVIIKALDTTSNGDVDVYMLTYADSKSIAQELKDLFNPTDNTGGNPFAALFGRRGGGGGGGFPGGGAGAEGATDAKRAAVHVTAVSDDENNAVIVSAPSDYLPGISNLITRLDIPQEDTVEIHVFALKHADPTDVATELAALFPDPTLQANTGNNTGRRGFQFTRGGGGAAPGAGLSERLKKQSTVLAVPDARTQSVIVTASKTTMSQIKAMIEELDSSDAHAMRVYVFQPRNADVMDLQGPIQDLFAGATGRTSSSSSQVNALTQRAQQAAQQQTMNPNGNSGTTGGGGGGGTTGLHSP